MTTPTLIPMPTMQDVIPAVGARFASHRIPKGAYFARSLALQAIGAAPPEAFLAFTASQLLNAVVVLDREFKRYFGTYREGTRLEFPDAQYARRYYDNLKRAQRTLRAALTAAEAR